MDYQKEKGKNNKKQANELQKHTDKDQLFKKTTVGHQKKAVLQDPITSCSQKESKEVQKKQSRKSCLKLEMTLVVLTAINYILLVLSMFTSEISFLQQLNIILAIFLIFGINNLNIIVMIISIILTNNSTILFDPNQQYKNHQQIASLNQILDLTNILTKEQQNKREIFYIEPCQNNQKIDQIPMNLIAQKNQVENKQITSTKIQITLSILNKLILLNFSGTILFVTYCWIILGQTDINKNTLINLYMFLYSISFIKLYILWKLNLAIQQLIEITQESQKNKRKRKVCIIGKEKKKNPIQINNNKKIVRTLEQFIKYVQQKEEQKEALRRIHHYNVKRQIKSSQNLYEEIRQRRKVRQDIQKMSTNTQTATEIRDKSVDYPQRNHLKSSFTMIIAPLTVGYLSNDTYKIKKQKTSAILKYKTSPLQSKEEICNKRLDLCIQVPQNIRYS